MAYKCRRKPLSGTSLSELERRVNMEYHKIEKRNPRRLPYVRAKYFFGGKVFISLFWQHIQQKTARERLRRLTLFPCAIELLQNTTTPPQIKRDPNNASYVLYRFLGLTPDGSKFYVQVKVNTKNGRRYLISTFPDTK